MLLRAYISQNRLRGIQRRERLNYQVTSGHALILFIALTPIASRELIISSKQPLRTKQMSNNKNTPHSIWSFFVRGCRLRCPVCGVGRLFKNLFQMNTACQKCDFKFQRDPGYFLGSVYINYGLTALLVSAGYLTFYFTEWLTPKQSLYVVGAATILFPMWFFRYARSFWLGFDQYFDPIEIDSLSKDHTNQCEIPEKHE